MSVARAAHEAAKLEEQTYIEMSPEERAQTTRPIYGRNSDGEVVIVGQKPVDLDECIQKLADLNATSTAYYAFETAAYVGVLSKTHKKYQDLADYLRSRNNAQPNNVNQPHVVNQVNQPNVVNQDNPPNAINHANAGANEVYQLDIDPFDLLALNTIPPLLEDDVVFSKYKCAITNIPIRHPVADPNGITLYEKSAILHWLRTHQDSPVTRAPLTRHQLLPRPALQAIINHRLNFHQGQLRAFIPGNLYVPPHAELQNQADAENPNYN